MEDEDCIKIQKEYFRIAGKYYGIMGLFRCKMKEEDYLAIRNLAKRLSNLSNLDQKNELFCAMLSVEMDETVNRFGRKLEGIISGGGCNA